MLARVCIALSAMVLIAVAIAGYALYSQPKHEVVQVTYIKICEDILRDNLLRPSSLEINRTETFANSMRIEDAIDLNDYSDQLQAQMRQRIAQRQNAFLSRRVDVYLDYSAETRGGGTTRDTILCTFVQHDFFTDLRSELRAFSIGNETYDDSSEGVTFLLINRASDRLSSGARVEGPTISDRLAYIRR